MEEIKNLSKVEIHRGEISTEFLMQETSDEELKELENLINVYISYLENELLSVGSTVTPDDIIRFTKTFNEGREKLIISVSLDTVPTCHDGVHVRTTYTVRALDGEQMSDLKYTTIVSCVIEIIYEKE